MVEYLPLDWQNDPIPQYAIVRGNSQALQKIEKGVD